MQQPPYPQKPPYQYPPQVPPPKKRGIGNFFAIGCGSLVVIIALAFVSCGQSQDTQNAQQAATAIAHDEQQMAQNAHKIATAETQKAHIIATLTAIAVQPTKGLAVTRGTPRIGGPISDFIGAYGQPNDHSNPGVYASQYHFQRDTNTTDVTDGLIVSTSADSKSVIDDITVAAVAQNATYNDPQAGSSFSPSDAKARCMTFAPSDAHFVKEFVYADNTGFDMVYTSASLAQSFPAGDFTDSQQNQVQAGMFDVSYLYKGNGDTQHIDSCDMIIGEQQTTN